MANSTTSYISDLSTAMTTMPTSYLRNLEDLKMDSNFAMLMSSLVFAVIWVIYITYYNSRLVGYIITKIFNRFVIGEGYFKIGSLSLNALSGKIMFRDVVYITHDYTIRIQDGYLIFRWWRAYVPKDVSEDLSHSDTRLSVMLNGFELHMYNRSELYASLERIFGIGNFFLPTKTDNFDKNNDNSVATASLSTTRNDDNSTATRKQRPEAAMARTWRDLIPVIKCDISSSRLVFGNRLIPTTLSITFEESHFVYSTKPAVCTLDRFMHFVKCKAENVRVMLAPSLKYTGMLDEPPRYMGEGFVLMSTNELELYFYMDEPGLVPQEPVLITLPNGDVVESSPPQWGVDIKCGKGTDFSYGPWADRQREHLFKFFYPQDYQPMQVSKQPKAGEKRQMQSFDIRLVMQSDATIDILFTKDKETNAVHINVGAGSYLEVTLPWITLQNGYTTKINGQLLHLEATTSLQYRDFVESETLEFSLDCHYPLIWNEHQLWEINLTGCKATVKLIFNHKWFFQDLINDWATKQLPDLIHFVPYTWRLGLTLKHCELITLVNQYNWIDCSSVGERNRLENTQIALCAHFLHLSFDLPFDEYLPETVPLNFSIQGESIDLSLFIPEFHTSKNIVKSLRKYAKILNKDGSTTNNNNNREIIPKWRNVCQMSNWVDFWWVPIGAINILYTYHPCPPLGTTPQADISTPVKEEILLSPMRFPHHHHHKKRANQQQQQSAAAGGPTEVPKFDPMSLKSDTVSVELEIGPSVLLLYGTALQNFMNFKENIFGEDQSFTDMQQQTNDGNSGETLKNDDSMASLPLELRDDFDARTYRPLEVDVSIIAHDVQAHLLMNCTDKDPPCPIILIERFGFEMKKRYDQTELQLLVSPSVLLVSDYLARKDRDKHLNQGRMTLSSLQVRGHAMFSNVGQSLDQDTIEYAWLIEVQLGKLSGKLTAPQLYSIVASLESLLLLVIDSENELNSPKNDALLSARTNTDNVKKQTNVSSGGSQNVHVQQMQQAIQQLLQPRNVQNTKSSQVVGSGAAGGTASGTTLTSAASLGATNQRKNVKNRIGGGDEEQKKVSGGGSMKSTTNEDTTAPRMNMAANAHKLKYKLCRVAIDAVDFWLVESGAALQLWISPIRLANCNLHGKQVSAGLSCIIYSLSLRQLVWQSQKYNHNKTVADGTDWLEVGAIQCGPLVIESAISSDIKEQNLHAVQQKFLKMHDDRFKKLWFLWPELATNQQTMMGKCGCTGGCQFFGRNSNGPRFFKPSSKKDLEDGINVAAFRINPPHKDPGFGQSILHENMLIFRTPPYIINEISLQDTLTRRNKAKEEAIVSSSLERKVSRRFSSNSIKLATNGSNVKEVPYARLVETAPAAIVAPQKKQKPQESIENLPKNSVSDSKLAVDYFTPPQTTSATPPPPAAIVPGGSSSESHHSLNSLQKQVQRTTSMSSENHSEAFFSADEDLINSPSSRNSILSSSSALNGANLLMRQDSTVQINSAPTQRKKFSSELSIIPTQASTHAPIDRTNRSDHEIHTPEHRSLQLTSTKHPKDKTVQVLITPQRIGTHHHHHHGKLKSGTKKSVSIDNTTLIDPDHDSLSSSDSYSSTSYVSAVGSQEDFTLVDLHMQINRLIIDSPMLMSSYVTHLTQCRCSNWDGGNGEVKTSIPSTGNDQFSVPMFEKNEENKLIYVGGRFVPQMETSYEGITSMKMISRKIAASPGESQDDADEGQTGEEAGDAETTEFDDVDELLSNQIDAGNRTIILVKLKGDLDVMFSPLLLESLQRFVDALTPSLAHMHPLTILNHLHYSCVGQVTSANTLKTTENLAKLYNATSNGKSNTYEELVKTQLQAAIYLPKINVTLLQVSIVEEIISFSALDNIKDLTCVSLFSISFDNVHVKLHCDRQARQVLQRFHRPAVVQSGKKHGVGGGGTQKISTNRAKLLLGFQSHTNADIIQGEPVFIENCEKEQQQFVFCLNIGKVHAQLRRLRNECSLLDDAVITAIPNYKSKVLFTPIKIQDKQYRGVEYYLQPATTAAPSEPKKNEFGFDDKLGFIMFECGLEGVALKVVKKSQFEQQNDCCQHGIRINKQQQSDESIKNNQEMDENVVEEANDEKAEEKTDEKKLEDKETNNDVSSCIIELKLVWFNFAAPPRTPITRKIDYTRLDWNLLSTASPAINAWMNPSNRLAIRVVHMVRTMYRRSTAVVACLMAEALETQKVHLLAKSRYDKLTPLAQTLQDDPSLQLCSILQQYYLDSCGDGEDETAVGATNSNGSGVNLIEMNLNETELPQLFTLRQGVIVLSRQWKNILYTPLLPEHTVVKTRIKPMNVTISVPEVDEVCILTSTTATTSAAATQDHICDHHHRLDDDYCLIDNNADDNNDDDNEHARLLHSGVIVNDAAAGTTASSVSNNNHNRANNNSIVKICGNKDNLAGYTIESTPQQVQVVPGGIESVLTSPSPTVPHRKRKKSLQQNANSSGRATTVLPLLTNQSLFATNEDYQHHHHQIYNVVASDPSEGGYNSHSSPELLPSSPLQHHKNTLTQSSEDLYSWMAKQDDNDETQNQRSLKGYMESKIDTSFLHSKQESKNQQQCETRNKPCASAATATPTLASNMKTNENILLQEMIPIHDSVRLLDANQIFQPLLSGLGVLPQQLRFTKTTTTNNTTTDSQTDVTTTTLDALGSNFCLVGNMETMHIDIVVSEHGKMEKKQKIQKLGKQQAPKKLYVDVVSDSPAFVCEKVAVELEIDRMTDMAVNEMMKTRNVLYISRGQLKNHTSTVINFTIGVRFISQRVNMPLLRLLHQISNMYQNVKDTQNELREEQPVTVTTTTNGTMQCNVAPPTATIGTSENVFKQLIGLKISDSSSTTKQNVISPSASIRSRPPLLQQSFAQKLRSKNTSKGYINLSETLIGGGNDAPGYVTPITTMSSPTGSIEQENLTRIDSTNLQTSSAQAFDTKIGRCWKTIYHLLDLYANMPDTKTIRHRFSVCGTNQQHFDISEHYKGNRKYDLLTEMKSSEDLIENDDEVKTETSGQQQQVKEHTKLIVFGVARIHRTRLLATLSGLKLEAEITSLHSSLTCRKKSTMNSASPHFECSLTGQIGRTMIVLLEGVMPNQQTVVKVTIGKSQTLYSSVMKQQNEKDGESKDKNSGLLTIGAVCIDIPQHPVALHGMVTRGSKELSSTLQELRVSRTASRLSRNVFVDEAEQQNQQQQQSPNHLNFKEMYNTQENFPSSYQQSSQFVNNTNWMKSTSAPATENLLLQPLVMQFSVILQSLSITAALLPSLQATYKMDQVNSTGFTGNKAKFTIDLPHHSLSFHTILHKSTKLSSSSNDDEKMEANLPSEASIALPAVHVSAEYIPENTNHATPPPSSAKNPDGVVFRQGGYLNAHADIGVFEHSLTTDLLNHLVFVQKVFMKEVNEVVQKVYGGERPVAIWLDEVEEPTAAKQNASSLNKLLFSLIIKIHRIQLTATTAGSSAVRLETGAVVFELSNRVQNLSGSRGRVNASSNSGNTRLFGKAQVDVNLSLGQIIRNALFEEADIEYQPVAFFNTRIGLRNAFQDEIVDSEEDNKEVVLITLKRPLIYIHPMAVDKAILVWLNYKNAYDYWNEKRANLNKEVLTATQQVYEKFQFGQLTSQLSASTHLATLFLQLTVEDMGICLPLNPLPLNWNAKNNIYEEGRGAVVITLENTSISACSSGSLVSKGKFSNLCLRFADDFETSLDDWKPDMSDASIMNLCVVSDGTYEVCSRTIAAKELLATENAKWFLNVQWQMEGVDIHLDTNVGKQLSALGHTLTMLTGAEEPQSGYSCDYYYDDSDENESTTTAAPPTAVASTSSAIPKMPLAMNVKKLSVEQIAASQEDGKMTTLSQESILPAFMFDPKLDNRSRSRLIEKEMNEQAKIINDLRSLGASHGTIEYEMKRLQELEAMAYKDFRKEMIQKLRRQSVRAQSIKGKFGLGTKNSRSKSFMVPTTSPINNVSSQLKDHEGGDRPLRSASLKNSNGQKVVSFVVDDNDGGDNKKNSKMLASASSEINLQQPDQVDWNRYSHSMEIDGEEVVLRKKFDSVDDGLFVKDYSVGNTSMPTTSGHLMQSTSGKSQEPNIDLELDVKVFINSGKCVLHTKDMPSTAATHVEMNRMRKDRSCSAGLLEFPQHSTTNSPDLMRKNKDKLIGGGGVQSGLNLNQMASSSRLRSNQYGGGGSGVSSGAGVGVVDLTIFHIPGMDVKLHYESKVIHQQQQEQQRAEEKEKSMEEEAMRIDEAFKVKSSPPIGISNPNYGYDATDDVKSASLTNLQFESGSETPTPPPSSTSCSSTPCSTTSSSSSTKVPTVLPTAGAPNKNKSSGGVKKASLFAWMTLQSVPEETIISPHILEFLEQTLEPIPPQTKQQQQQQEMLEKENLLDSSTTTTTNYGNYVYASFPVDVIVYFHMQPSTFRFSCLPVSRVECMLQLPSLDIVFSSKRAEDELFEFNDATTTSAGTTGTNNGSGSPTAATAVGGLSVTGCLSDFSVYIFHPYGGGKKSTGQLKDVSLMQQHHQQQQWSPLSDSERKDSLSINVEFVKFHLSRSRMLNLKQESRAVIRFSTIVDIGSASFKYDMRRLTEILAFPKAWYRRSIVRRMFLGDLSSMPAAANASANSEDLSGTQSGAIFEFERKSSLLPTKVKSARFLRKQKQQQQEEFENDFDSETPSPTSECNNKSLTSWETLVLFAVNFKKLNVHMNMGNVMGNVTWLTKDFRSDGRLSIGSTGHKNLYIALGLGGSGLDAKGGIVGGNIEIAQIDTFVHIREEPDVEPDHTVGLKLHALELRLDYMATSVLMCRVSALNVNLRDEWKLNRMNGMLPPTKRPAQIFMHGDLTWDQLQMMISKSTTADLLKMFNKLEEFFSQQFNSSKRAFSGGGSAKEKQQQQQQQQSQQKEKVQRDSFSEKSQSNLLNDARHHRHWQKVMQQVAGLQLTTMDVPLPEFGTILGGTMELYGKNISLACFHGLNFKSKSWALFSLKEPSITFNTEAQEISRAGTSEMDLHVVQTLTCSLGSNTYKTHLSMATVCKVSRSVIFPPQFKTLQEWFHYAFANSQIDEVDKFPSLEKEKFDAMNSIERARNSGGGSGIKLVDPNHNREVIFALPSLQLHLKTEHFQTAQLPNLNSEDDKPVVECSFITEFEDHIFVTVDAEAFFFLHDLITSYVKEKERVFTSNDKQRSSMMEKKSSSLDVDIFAKDWRNYNCKTWHLEPTVRLLSVAGKYIEPYGIDYILQKLGFSHARTTIPKWMQRGFMDPLDAILAVLTMRMVQVVRGDANNRNSENNGSGSGSGVESGNKNVVRK